MQNKPIGKPKLVKGTIDLNNFFGFQFVDVECPDLKVPFLPYKTKNGLITPTGTWSGWYFSEELKHALTQGYKITIKGKGYSFDQGKPFDDYVNHFYTQKAETNDPTKREISKQFLNSLYGRFGLKNVSKEFLFLNNEEFLSKVDNNDLRETFKIDEDQTQYSISNEKGKSFSNVAIAAAITSYSRIHKDKFKRLKKNPIYYSETDSVFLKEPQDDKYISNKIGAFKQESLIEKAVFVSPKTYAYITQDGKSVVKVKGFNSDQISYGELESLLIKDKVITKEESKRQMQKNES